MSIPFKIRTLQRADYEPTWQQMKDFTTDRNKDSADEFWIVEHNPVYTLGLAGKEEHFLQKVSHIPIIRTDRGGQVTYHGPGQVVIYTLIDIARAKLTVRSFVERLEDGIIQYLASLNIVATSDAKAPGVYIDNKKIASLGLKIRKNCTYHGISFNLAMDLTPFSYINVCGYSGLKMVQLCDLVDVETNVMTIGKDLTTFIAASIYH